MLKPWLMVLAVASLLFAYGIAYLFVHAFNWRYTDWTGLNSQPFDASGSVLAYTVLGSIGWPIVWLLLWLTASDVLRQWRRRQRRACVGKHC